MYINILRALIKFINRHPKKMILIVLTVTLLSGWYTITNLKFNMDRNALVSHDQEYNKLYEAYEKEFEDLEEPMVVIENNNLTQTKAFASYLCKLLMQNAKHVKSADYQFDDTYFRKHFLLYLSYDELLALKGKLDKLQSHLPYITASPGLSSIFSYVAKEMESIQDEGKQGSAQFMEGFDLLQCVFSSAATWLDSPKTYNSPWEKLFSPNSLGTEEDRLFLSDNKRLLFVMIQINGQDVSEAIQEVRESLEKAKKLYPDIKAGFTGRPVLDYDEMETTNQDMNIGAIISLSCVALLFIFSFRQVIQPLDAIFCLIVGIVLTFGVTTLCIGYLNILTSAFAIMLIGSGLDFGIHIIGRFSEELQKTLLPSQAIEEAVTKTGWGITTSATTTAAAFYAAMFTDFQGIVELGFIGGTGVLLCLTVTLTLLPALLVSQKNILLKKYSKLHAKHINRDPGHKTESFFSTFPRFSLAVTGVITLFAIWSGRNLYYDYNLLNLQSTNLESVKYELKIIEESKKSTWFGAVIASSLDEARGKVGLLEKLPSVGSVESILPMIPDDQEKKLELVNEMKPCLNSLNFVGAMPMQLSYSDLSKSLSELEKNLKNIQKLLNDYYMSRSSSKSISAESVLGYIEGSIKNMYNDIVSKKIKDYLNKITLLQKATASFHARLAKGDNITIEELDKFEKELFMDLQAKLATLQEAMSPSLVRPEDMPEQLKRQFMGKTGKFRILVFPEENVWERAPMKEFLDDLRKVDPNVTGSVVQVYESTYLMKSGYEKAIIYAAIAILLLLLIDFRSFKYMLLASLPLVIGGCWFIGLISEWNIPLNPANVIALPLVLGIGVDSGVLLVHRYKERKDKNAMIGTSTGWAVTLSSFTTMIGFGALAVASHRGVASLGLALTIGVGCCLLATWSVLPALFTLMRRKEPIESKN